MNKCVFLDRDGVLNYDHGDYTYRLEDFHVLLGVPEALRQLKEAGFLLVVITNQAGIAKGLYTDAEVNACHDKLQGACGGIIDAFYHSPYHPSVTQSIGRKPGSLLFEKAIAKFQINPLESWMIGDRSRDIEAAQPLQIKGIFIEGTEASCAEALYSVKSLSEAVPLILGQL
ncbi:HAD family hydrolase [Cytophagales bacterium LB-30]|uniref:D,D-heptose 1,7-bisphosphate phosphatase n=1 Tax=Shiella aurantiaca TaxID=3058365 RepID=A0ABT8F3X0_9BACT|nr:HAD family hydrolase [Shiella aurantiaca]MDN4164969.1 HAD family hydrolase [Shiella aurantiaca]